jgi:hypothetical protein
MPLRGAVGVEAAADWGVPDGALAALPATAAAAMAVAAANGLARCLPCPGTGIGVAAVAAAAMPEVAKGLALGPPAGRPTVAAVVLPLAMLLACCACERPLLTLRPSSVPAAADAALGPPMEVAAACQAL